MFRQNFFPELQEHMSRTLKRTILITVAIIAVFVIVVIAFISPIAKYLIEKYDVKYTGREITMDYLYLNPFTGNSYFRNLKIYEQRSDSVFFSFTGLTVNVEVGKLLSKNYEISEVTLTNPRGIFIRNKDKFNFSDLVEMFTPDSIKPKDTSAAPLHLNIMDVTVKGGEFRYIETNSPVKILIKEFHFKSPGKYWNKDTVVGNLSLLSGIGSGKLAVDFKINVNTMDYHMGIQLEKFDLAILQQYLKEISKYGTLKAFVDAKLTAKGNFNQARAVDARGHVTISDFHLAKTPGEDYLSFGTLKVGIIRLNPDDNKYMFDTVALDKPFVKYEQYDYLNNLERMFGEKGSKIKNVKGNPEQFNLILQLADYIKELSKNFFHSYYKVNRLAITNGKILFNDFSPSEQFSVAAAPLSFIADSIDKNKRRVHATFTTGIQPYGKASVLLSMNPKDEGDFDMNFHLGNVPIPMFNPYLITYTSFPLDRGTIEMNAKWHVLNGQIQSNNHLLLIDPRVTKKVKKQDTKWIPMPLIMSFIRERGNVIDYTIPITGNLKDPKFHLSDVIMDLLKNIVVKPATTPYRMDVKEVETKVEKSLKLTWRMRQVAMNSNQIDFVSKIADFLKKNDQASVTVYPVEYEEKEKEHILLFEARKRYFLSKNNKKLKDFTEEDSATVENMSIKDSQFKQYLNRHLKDTSMIFTVQQKARLLVGKNIVDEKYKSMEGGRKQQFMKIFKDKGVENKVKFTANHDDVPFGGFSYYRLAYPGDIPDDLKKAFEELRDYNEEAPRDKYHAERKNIFQRLFKK